MCDARTGAEALHVHWRDQTVGAHNISAEMDLPRTFVSFSSTDIGRYHLMCAWKAHEHSRAA
jgi:hypothetical protein